jgi:hypothetical protein
VTESYDGFDPEWLRAATELARQFSPDSPGLMQAAEAARQLSGTNTVAVAALARWASQIAERLPYSPEDYAGMGEYVHGFAVTSASGSMVLGGSATVQVPKPAVEAAGRVATPTLPAKFAQLPCGQRLGIVVIGLAVLLALDLPPDVRDHVAYVIAVLTAALWLASKVTDK